MGKYVYGEPMRKFILTGLAVLGLAGMLSACNKPASSWTLADSVSSAGEDITTLAYQGVEGRIEILCYTAAGIYSGRMELEAFERPISFGVPNRVAMRTDLNPILEIGAVKERYGDQTIVSLLDTIEVVENLLLAEERVSFLAFNHPVMILPAGDVKKLARRMLEKCPIQYYGEMAISRKEHLKQKNK